MSYITPVISFLMRKIDSIAYDDHFVSVGGRLNPSFGNVSNTGILLPRLCSPCLFIITAQKEGSNKNRDNPKALHTLKFESNHLTSTCMKFFPILENCTTVFLVPPIEIFGANSSRSWLGPDNKIETLRT